MRIDWFDQKIHCAVLHATHNIILACIRCNQNDWQLRSQCVGLQAMQQRKSCTSASQTDIYQRCANPISILLQKGKRLIGFLTAFHPKHALEYFIQDRQIQFRIIYNQQRIAYHMLSSLPYLIHPPKQRPCPAALRTVFHFPPRPHATVLPASACA